MAEYIIYFEIFTTIPLAQIQINGRK